MIVKILIGVAGLVALLLALAARRPSAYRVERRLDMAASPERVFARLNDLRGFAGVLVLFGSPWEQSDPQMKKTFSGPAGGAGQSLAWEGNKEAGQGRMTIEESVPGRKVAIRLEFEKPLKSTSLCLLTLAEAPGGTTVMWVMEGRHIFLGQVMSLFMNMDRMLGADLEKGLARLKSAVEGGA